MRKAKKTRLDARENSSAHHDEISYLLIPSDGHTLLYRPLLVPALHDLLAHHPLTVEYYRRSQCSSRLHLRRGSLVRRRCQNRSTGTSIPQSNLIGQQGGLLNLLKLTKASHNAT